MSGKPETPPMLARGSNQLLGDIRQMIEETRSGVAATVNAGLTMLYWRIGSRIQRVFPAGVHDMILVLR